MTRHAAHGRPVRHTMAFFDNHGEPVETDTCTATDAKNQFAIILNKTIRGDRTIITKHDKPTAVVLPFDEFVALAGWRGRELNMLSEEFDELLARMQTPKARAGMKAAFGASPAQLGKAAVAAAARAKAPRTRG